MGNKYGYKVCYFELGKTSLKIHMVCNTLYGAIWNVQYYEKHQKEDEAYQKLRRVWCVLPIETIIEFNKLWEGCPF